MCGAEYLSALGLDDRKDHAGIYCKWAACELKAGNAEKGEELLQKAQAEKGNRLAVAFSMLIEVIRLKLPRSLKTRLDKEFNAGLAEPPSGQVAAALADTIAAHRAVESLTLAKKRMRKRCLPIWTRPSSGIHGKPAARGMCRSRDAGSHQADRGYSKLGSQRFPDDAYFPLFEVAGYFARGPQQCPVWKVRPLLEKGASWSCACRPIRSKNYSLNKSSNVSGCSPAPVSFPG